MRSCQAHIRRAWLSARMVLTPDLDSILKDLPEQMPVDEACSQVASLGASSSIPSVATV